LPSRTQRHRSRSTRVGVPHPAGRHSPRTARRVQLPSQSVRGEDRPTGLYRGPTESKRGLGRRATWWIVSPESARRTRCGGATPIVRHNGLTSPAPVLRPAPLGPTIFSRPQDACDPLSLAYTASRGALTEIL